MVDDVPESGDSADSAEDDQRESLRHPIELKVEYKRLNKFFADYTKNICKGGTFIKTDKPLDIGTEFVFKLYVPKLEEPLSLKGQVKWLVRPEDAAAAGDQREPGMGIRFLFDDESERTEIAASVEKLMVDSLGQLLTSKLMGRGGGRTE